MKVSQSRGASTPVCRVETSVLRIRSGRLDAFRCWRHISVSLKASFAALFLLAASAHAQITNISITNVSLTPASGSSASGVIQTFTAVYSDSYGSGDIVDAYFQAKAAYTSCYVQYDSPTNGFTLRNDGGTAWLGPISPGSSSTLQNSVCTLYGTGSSVAAGTQFTMTLSLSFTAQFAGTNATYMSAYGNLAGSNAFQQMGTWIVNASNYPDLTIAMNHTPGSFTQGQTGTYNITVTNGGAATSSGTVQVTGSLRTGLNASSINGSGWSCTQPGGPCTRSDALAAGGSYPTIALAVSVDSNAASSLAPTATVAGGGETNTSNDTATDTTTIVPSGGGGGTDLALNKAATQSSTLSDSTFVSPLRAASLAVDGNTDGQYYDGSVSTTNYDQNAWWQVDLGSSATVNTVVVWNRTDCCNPPRLADYWVFVSNTPFLSTDTPATLQGRAGTWSSHQTTSPSPSTTVSPNGSSGRYVRVQLTGTNYLSLAEVQVFGTAGGSVPDLTVTMNHSPASFTQGQTGTYNITVTNSGTAATPNGTQVKVVAPLPAGLTATSMSGSGWSCTLSGGSCTRSDALAAGIAYPTIALAAGVDSNAASSLAPTATVSGGGEADNSNDTATDITTIIPCCGGGTLATMASPPPGSQLTGSTVTFTWYAASGATQYWLYVGTTGIGSADILSANTGLNLTQQVTGLPVNGNTVYVRLFTYFSTSWQSIDYTYAAYGCGGSCAPVLTLSKSHMGNFTQGQAGTYTITVGNSGTGATNGSLVTASDTLPQGLTLGSMSGTGWNCSGASCSRSDALAAGSSYPAITLTANVTSNAPNSVTNQASVSGGGSGSNTANDITAIGASGLLPNPSFESGSSTPVSNSQQYSSVPSAASGWMIYNNAANTKTTTELCTATSCPSGSSSPMPPADGTHTMHITTGGQWNGIYETFNSTALVSVSMSLKVVSGTVLVELIGDTQPYTYTVVSTSGPMTLPANGTFNEIVIYSASSGAEFYVDNVILTPGGTGTVSITLTSSPPGLGLAIDGIGCTTPCATQTWTAGSTHTIGAGTQPGATGVQYVFTGWADGGTASPRTVTPSVSTTYTANFTPQYLLTTSATAGGTISPASEWVNAGGVIAVSASANTGYQFTGFSGGALAGNTTPQNLTMNGPASVTANFTAVPTGDFSIAVFDSAMRPVSNFPITVPLPPLIGIPPTYQFIVQVTPKNGFTGAINFDSYSQSPSTQIILPRGIPGITVSDSSPVSILVPFTVSSNAALVQYTLTFNAYSQYKSHANNAAYFNVTNGQLSAACSATPNPATVSQNVTFRANASGGTQPYTYLWSGAGSGTAQTAALTPLTAGNYSANVTVRDSASGSATASCGVTVMSASTFMIAAASLSPQPIVPGASATYTVTVYPGTGFNGSVNFTVTGLPAGGSVNFSPATVTGSGSTTMTVNTAPGTSVSNFTILITGSSGSLNRTTAALLTVAAPAPANMTSPAPGATLTSNPATFTWDSGAGASQYQLAVGSSLGGVRLWLGKCGHRPNGHH